MDVKLPKLGEGAESGVVVSILVKEGDRIAAGQTVLELENEKAVAPIPATVGGVVTRIRVKEGDRIAVGAVLFTVDSGDGGKAAAKSEPAEPEPVAKPARKVVAAAAPPPVVEPVAGVARIVETIPQKSDAPIAAAPAIRRLASDLGIDLTRVRGSERGGRIGMNDLRTYIELIQRLAFQRPEPTPAAEGKPARVVESIDFSKWGPVTRKPLSTLRKTIAQRMSESWQAVPRVTQFDEADITRLNELRKKHAKAYEAKGTRLTLTSFAVKAVAETLRKHPAFNSSLDEAAGDVVLKDYVHIGLAVDTEAGLIVPVIRDADKKDLLQLSKDIEALAAKARDRKVSLDDLKGGSFTISNQGGIGGGPFTPVINLPEVAILGMGRGALKPAVRDGKIEPRLLVPLGLSYDHRVIDGGSAARFIVDLVKAFEEFPESAVKI